MKKVLALLIAVTLLMAMATVALAADATVYVTVSIDGNLEVAAEPVSVSELTAEGVLKAAHAAFYAEGESGYEAGIDPTWNMFMITKAWGIAQTPFVVVNDAPLGSPSNPATADAAPVKDGDNIIICISSDPMTTPATPVSLTVSIEGDTATVTATSWTLDFTTFAYSSAPLSDAAVIDPATGASIGVTDADGSITVPAEGTVAIDGLAAIPVDGSSASTSGGTAPSAPSPADPAAPGEPSAPSAPSPADPAAPEEDLPLFKGDTLLIVMTIGGILVFIPVIFVITFIGRKQEKMHWEKSRKI